MLCDPEWFHPTWFQLLQPNKMISVHVVHLHYAGLQLNHTNDNSGFTLQFSMRDFSTFLKHKVTILPIKTRCNMCAFLSDLEWNAFASVWNFKISLLILILSMKLICGNNPVSSVGCLIWHYNIILTYFSKGGTSDDSSAQEIKEKKKKLQHSCLLVLPGCLSPSPLIPLASNENMLTANTPFNFTPHFPFVLKQ